MLGLDRQQASNNIKLQMMWDGVLGDRKAASIDTETGEMTPIISNDEGIEKEKELFDFIKESEQDLIDSIGWESDIDEIFNRNWTDDWFSHEVSVTFEDNDVWLDLQMLNSVMEYYIDLMPDRMEFHTYNFAASEIEGNVAGMNRPFATSDILCKVRFSDGRFLDYYDNVDEIESRLESKLDRSIDVNEDSMVGSDAIIIRFIDQSRVVDIDIRSSEHKVLRDKNIVTDVDLDTMLEDLAFVADYQGETIESIAFKNR